MPGEWANSSIGAQNRYLQSDVYRAVTQVLPNSYEYDELNRFTVSMGSLSGARATNPNDASVHIVVGAAGGDGVQLGYNAAGERMLAVYAKDGRTERYTYDANGFLETQTINGVVAQQRTNDLLGRVTSLVERDVATGKVVTNVTRSWDADSLQTSGRDTLNATSTTYTRMADGTLLQIDSKPDDSKATRTTSTYTYEWWDGARQSKVVVQASNPSSPGWKPATSYYNYDANGNLKSTYDDGGDQPGNARAFQYWTDLRGQVQRRDELTGVAVNANGEISGATGNRKHNYYYLNGNRVGNQGNDGIDSIDYVQELAGKLAKGSENQFKVFTPVSTADFDENYMAINASYPGSSPGHWTVRDGDTLQSIASALWGDATLWYILADANGLQGTDSLRGGEVLTVPNRVTNIHNTATTFKPYDPGKAIGNTQPTLPDPPPPPSAQNGCGTFMSVIAIVVAVVVTIYTAGAAASAMSAGLASTAGGTAAAGTVAAGTATAAGASTWSLGVAAMSGGLSGGMAGAGAVAAAAGAAAGSVASQAVLMAGGQQKGFDWRQVGLSAATGGLAGGIAGPTTSVLGSGTGAAFTVGAMRGVATQGLGILVGAQTSFDWKGVAASTIAWGVGTAVGNTGLGKVPVAGQAASNMAAGIMGTLVRGGSVERNLGSIALDATAATVGNMVAQQVAAQSQSSSAGKSSRYGVGGDVDSLVAQSGYAADPGKQFAWSANAQFSPTGSYVDATASNLMLTPGRAQALMVPDNGPSIVGPSLNGPGVDVRAVPYPQISVSPLPESNVALAQTDGGFWRGLSGDKRSVFEAPAPLSEQVGAGVRWAADTFVVDPLKELGNQYHDLFVAAAGGARDGWSSHFAQQVTSGDYTGAALSEAGMVGGVMPLAGAGLKGLNTLGPTADLMFQQGLGRMGALSYVVENGSAGSALNAPFSPLAEGGGLAAHEAAGGHLLLKHVGQSESQLMQRLASEPTITGSSSFYDRATAESAISDTLAVRQPEISAWLASSKPQFKVEYSLPKDVGITVTRGASSAVDTSNLRLILRRDPTMPSGYRIHTGFPTQ